MSDTPLISIVIATYNCAGELPGCLDSILSQDGGGVEILVADGASSDGTVEILERYGPQLAWWASAADEGIYDAWNQALPRARGTWVLFLGADDRLLPDTLAPLCTVLSSRSDLPPLVYCRMALAGVGDFEPTRRGAAPGDVGWQLRHGWPLEIPHSAMLHRRSLFEEFGLFDTGFRIAGDYEFITRVTRGDHSKLAFLPDITLVEKGMDGVSATQRLRGIRETRRARLQNGLPGVTLPWLLVAGRAYLRELLRRSTSS